jgi:hypothetical protein
MKISRTTLNFALDSCLLLSFLALVFVGSVVRFIFPTPQQANDWFLWTWGLDEWMRLQFAVLAVLTLGILLHLMMHWSWLCGVVTGWLPRTADGRKRNLDEGTRTIAGVGLLVVVLNLLGLLIAAAALTIQRPSS